VGITRAKERLFLTHASARRLYGNQRESAMASMFLDELPRHVLQIDRPHPLPVQTPTAKAQRLPSRHRWHVGDRCLHRIFGVGTVTHVFGQEPRIHLGIQFENHPTPKMIDPRLVELTPLD